MHSKVIDVNVYTFNTNIPLPTYGTQYASCFDLSYQNPNYEAITVYDTDNNKLIRSIDPSAGFIVYPRERALVPTGMIFELPDGYDMRIHPRSGLSIKNGITLINAEGVIDEDYRDILMIPLHNASTQPFVVTQGMRIAQGEIRLNRLTNADYLNSSIAQIPWTGGVSVNFQRTLTRPELKGNRAGGFGSTG